MQREDKVFHDAGDLSGVAIFANTEYVGWYRDLFEILRAGTRATLLFDSTISEPVDLLRKHAGRALAEEFAQRFPSTFGWGSPQLIDSIARRYHVPESAILTTAGCTSAISHVYSTFLEPGAHVIIERPNFELLPRLAAHRSAKVSFLERETGTLAIDPERLKALINSRTRLIVLTNAHNPSGAYLDVSALKSIAEVANKFDLPVLVDEVYGDLVPEHLRAGPAALIDPCFISVNSLTKAYGLQALRCGWIIASEGLLKRIRPVYAQVESGSSKLTHGIASLAIDELEAYQAHWRFILDRNIPVARRVFADLQADGLVEGDVPQHGCMYFPRLPKVRDVRRMAAWMWDEARLVIAPGDFFGAPQHVRIGYGQSGDAIETGLVQFAAALRSYGTDA